MTLLEFYNAIINVTRESGQGVPLFIAERAGLVADLDNMVKLGKLKKINTSRSGGEDSVLTFYCLPNIFCAEEHEAKGANESLMFVRRFLNILDDSFFPFRTSSDSLSAYNAWLDSTQESYGAWLKDNREGLEAIVNLTPLTTLDEVVNKE